MQKDGLQEVNMRSRTQAAIWLCLVFLGHCWGQFYQSNPSCGVSELGQYVQVPPSLSGNTSFGVCDWGITRYTNTRPDSYAGKCLNCKPTSALRPDCPSGWKLNKEEDFWLAPADSCKWSQGCLDVPCPSGYAEAEQAVCGAGGRARLCCPLKQHWLCCKAETCQTSDTAGGKCLVQDKDLLPGQSISATVYAVAAASTLCTPYSFTIQRTCQADRSFAAGQFYDSCTTLQLSRDGLGCIQVPGYELVPGFMFPDAATAAYDDGTQWGALPTSAAASAAVDPVLMAARCSMTDYCAGFDTSGSVTLRAYLPLQQAMVNASQLAMTANISLGACSGTYVRQTEAASKCPRIPGYLFTPGLTWGPTGPGAPAPACTATTCGNTTAMAAACDADDACTAFSHMHGLQTGSGAGASSSMFTQSPCRGLYTRVLGALPSEVEALDQLLCGDNTYCTTPPTYISSSASTSANEALDITVTITAPMQTPPRLLNPSQGTIDALPRLLRVSRLRIACSGGGRLTGGLPRHLLRVTPRLTRLVMAGCGLADVLPQDWATLAPPSLRALDLSDNALRGPLPAAWALDPTSASPSSASHTLGLAHLNLSRNSLTGPIPAGWWQGVLARSSGGYDDQDVAASPMLADLQHNQLSGPVDMRIVREACGLRDVALYFAAVAASWVSGREAGATPVLLLGGNSGLAQWAGKYDRLQGKRVYTPDDHQDNMCGNYWYIVHIMVLWGCFVLALAAIAVWAVLAVRAKRKAAALKAHRREQARLARIAQLQQQQQVVTGTPRSRAHDAVPPLAEPVGSTTAAAGVAEMELAVTQRAATDAAPPRKLFLGGSSPSQPETAQPPAPAADELTAIETLRRTASEGGRSSAHATQNGAPATTSTFSTPASAQQYASPSQQQRQHGEIEPAASREGSGRRLHGVASGPAAVGSDVVEYANPVAEMATPGSTVLPRRSASVGGGRSGTGAAASAAATAASAAAQASVLTAARSEVSAFDASSRWGGSSHHPGGWPSQLWASTWVRFGVRCARLAVLVADVGMDIWVVAWLWERSQRPEASAGIAFLAIPQAAVALAIFAALFLRAFPSLCALVTLGPLVLAATPVIGPVLAAWHLVNPEVPLVAWRYVQLVEFCVGLLQAPAQAIIQSVAYAHAAQSTGTQVEGWQMLVASIALSLADAAIVGAKMITDRKGPRGRLYDALTDLSSPGRDVSAAYEELEDGEGEADAYAAFFTDARPTQSQVWRRNNPVPRPTRGESYVDPLLGPSVQLSADSGGALVSMRNPLHALAVAARQQQVALSAAGASPRVSGTFGSPLENSGATSAEEAGMAVRSPSVTGPGGADGARASYSHSTARAAGPSHSGSAVMRVSAAGSRATTNHNLARTSRGSQASDGANSVASSAWSMRLPPPPMTASMLTQSSLHLAVSSAMGNMQGLMGVPLAVDPISTRRAPTTASTSTTTSQTSTRNAAIGRAASDQLPSPSSAHGPLGKPPLPRGAGSATPTPALAAAVARAATAPGRSPLGKRSSNSSVASTASVGSSAAGSFVMGHNPAYGSVGGNTSAPVSGSLPMADGSRRLSAGAQSEIEAGSPLSSRPGSASGRNPWGGMGLTTGSEAVAGVLRRMSSGMEGAGGGLVVVGGSRTSGGPAAHYVSANTSDTGDSTTTYNTAASNLPTSAAWSQGSSPVAPAPGGAGGAGPSGGHAEGVAPRTSSYHSTHAGPTGQLRVQLEAHNDSTSNPATPTTGNGAPSSHTDTLSTGPNGPATAGASSSLGTKGAASSPALLGMTPERLHTPSPPSTATGGLPGSPRAALAARYNEGRPPTSPSSPHAAGTSPHRAGSPGSSPQVAKAGAARAAYLPATPLMSSVPKGLVQAGGDGSSPVPSPSLVPSMRPPLPPGTMERAAQYRSSGLGRAQRPHSASDGGAVDGSAQPQHTAREPSPSRSSTDGDAAGGRSQHGSGRFAPMQLPGRARRLQFGTEGGAPLSSPSEGGSSAAPSPSSQQ